MFNLHDLDELMDKDWQFKPVEPEDMGMALRDEDDLNRPIDAIEQIPMSQSKAGPLPTSFDIGVRKQYDDEEIAGLVRSDK